MILVDLLDVAPAKSPASTSTVFKPRSCASRAQPAPVAPPPITQTSNDFASMLRSVSSRLLMKSPVPNSRLAHSYCATGRTFSSTVLPTVLESARQRLPISPNAEIGEELSPRDFQTRL